jgi:esterase/lipase superfamily enzyme
MSTTVFFATNRVLTGPNTDIASYSTAIQPGADPTGLIYGTAFVDGIDIATNTQGTVSSIQNVATGDFMDNVASDLSAAGRNLLVFIHGFDNNFSDALTRGAFNREWMAASGIATADTTVIAFSWPSLGQILAFPILQSDYQRDQSMAHASGYHLMTFFSRLEPILTAARAAGQRTYLLAHSMGNLALEAATESWFANGNGVATLFDRAILAAGDCVYNAFAPTQPVKLSALPQLSRTVAVYYSHADAVLQFSQAVNLGAQRLGQDGPQHRTDPAAFPAATYTMVDATGFQDYNFTLLTSHQYYRSSPTARASIIAGMR